MCGIFGVVGNSINKYKDNQIKEALFSLKKRGPDDSGMYKSPNCILAHTRLSIIDISGGKQPMFDEKENFIITFNGEIYNFKDIKKILEDKGYKFNTNSDTEIILMSYKEYGEKCLDLFEGMYAFAIFNKNKNELFIARDRFGKKPFYYTFDDDNNFIFSSEIKAIFSLGGIKGEINPEAINDYLRLLYIPPYKTIYKNIYTLKPAHFGIIKINNIRDLKIQRYWNLENKEINISYDEAKEKIKKLLDKSITRRMISDVNVGSMLSGGVDSTLISFLAQKKIQSPLKTFSVGFEDFINELPYAREAAEKIQSDHNELVMNIDIAKELTNIYSYLDEPNADASIIPTYLISKLAKEKNTSVLLSGDGADELFIGYGWYWKYWNIGWKIKIKSFNLFPNQFRYFLNQLTSFIDKKERKLLWKNKIYSNSKIFTNFSNDKNITDLKKITNFDINMYLPGDLLSKVDRLSMMASVEVRCPFLDKELFEFVYNLPAEYKTDKKSGKIILKEILGEIMPKEFVNRRKQGFGPPIINWLLKKEMKKLVKEIFITNKAEIYLFFKEDYVKKIINEFYIKNNSAKYGIKLWILICLELWFKNNKKHIKI